ncbi:carboxymuconolactone decarboxylase family protein [Flavobacterium sp. Sd200]|uniref:carboxymuconolactone decarboxylase family protein n=1 Tax=Flavobacterium sp. Sd200 TaxID=2692211 RepID=UPI00136BBB46|nr:carboxymuconolactone decarboxylase family protein [Flavobacterium sp. Sd200]MXN92082.1 carboxymuconolactone decarboxylase family protein [Flavobacterium sp. Sd200]
MKTRINLFEVEPNGYKAMLSLEKYLATTSITKTHAELIKIRASQINGCAFCLDMHTKDARKNGETEQRIYTVSAWRDTPFFTPEEQALLALTEEVTLIANHVKDETFSNAVALLGEKYVSEVIMLIITINGWNRIAITTGMMPK